MGCYTVFTLADEEGNRGSGLTLSEAFARVMALSSCDYIFRRVDGVMRLVLAHHDDVTADSFAEIDHRDYASRLVDDAMARADIMRQFLVTGFKGWHIVTDEYWQREEAKEHAAEERERADFQALCQAMGSEKAFAVVQARERAFVAKAVALCAKHDTPASGA